MGKLSESTLTQYTTTPIDPGTGLQSGKLSSSRLSTKSTYDVLMSGYNPLVNTGSVTGPLSKYDTAVSREDIIDEIIPGGYSLTKERGMQQPGIAQFGAMLNQAIVGRFIGGTIEDIGDLFDFKQYSDLVKGTEEEFGNSFVDIGKKLQTWAEETTPIYNTYDQGEFAPGNWSWWMTNATSLGSALSLLVPATGVAKILGWVGKGLKLAKGLEKIGLSAKALKATEIIGQGATQAVVSRHLESLMEARDVYESSYQELVQKGVSEEDARKAAAKGASSVYNRNWAMLVQDIPQYIFLNRILSGKFDESIKAMKAVGRSTKAVAAKRFGEGAVDLLSESGEEAYQYIVGEEGRLISEKAAFGDAIPDTEFSSRLNTYLHSGDLWTSAFWGAAGAGVYRSVGHALKKSLNGQVDPQYENLKGWSSEFAFWASKATKAKADNDNVTFKGAVDGLISTLGTKAVATGNKENLKEFLRKLQVNEAKDDLGVDKEHVELFKESLPEIEQSIDRIDELYTNNYKTTQDHKLSQILTSREFFVERLDKLENEVSASKATHKNSIVDIDKVSATGRDLMELDIEKNITQLQLAKANLTKQTLSKDNSTELDRQLTDKSIKRLEDKLKKLDDDIKVKTELYTPELKAQDNKVKVDLESKPFKDYISAITDLSRITEDKEHAKDTIEFYRKHKSPITKEESQKVEETRQTQKADEVSIAHNTEPAIEAGDKVKYTDKETGVEREYTVNKVNEDTTVELTTIPTQPSKEIDDFVNRIISGEQLSSAEDLQFYENNKKEIENILQEKQSTSKSITTVYDEVQLVEKQVTTETDNLSEEVTDEGSSLQNIFNKEREKSKRGLTKPSTMLAWWGINPESKISESKADDGITSLDELVSDPTVDLSKAEIEYEIDTNTYTSGQRGFWQRTTTGSSGKIYKHEDLDGSVALTVDQINDILNTNDDPITSSDFVDSVNIKLRLTINGHTFTNGVFLHLTNYNNISVPFDVIDEAEEKNDPNIIIEYKRKQMINTRVFRRNVLRHLLAGNSVKMVGLERTTGHFNNTKDKDGKPTKNNIAKVLGKQPNNIKVGVSTKVLSGKIWISDNENLGNASSLGNVFVATDKTANGKMVPMKCNVSKLSEEHADILWEAYIQKIQNGANAKMVHPQVEGLTNLEVITMLVNSGTNTLLVDPKTGQQKDMPPHLINKQLYDGRDKDNNNRVTVFAGINKFELFPFGSEDKSTKAGWTISKEKQAANKKAFIEWATTNKNYAVHKKITPTATNKFGFSVELNKQLSKEFKIGSWENKPTAKGVFPTYGGFLIKNNVITTDVQQFKDTKSVTHYPGLILQSNPNLSDSIITKSTVKKEPVKKPEPVVTQVPKKAVDAVVENKGEVQIKSRSDLNSLAPGAVVYTIDPTVGTDSGVGSNSTYIIFKISQSGIIEIPNATDSSITKKYSGRKYNDKEALDGLYEDLLKIGIEYIKQTIIIKLETSPQTVIKAADAAPQTQPIPGGATPTASGSVNTTNKLLNDIGDDFNPEQEEAPFMDESLPNETKANLAKEIKWFRKKLGNLPIEVQDKIITSMLTGRRAYGQFRGNSILLYEGAVRGVLYHEAFHRVSLTLLTREQRTTIYNEAKQRYKDQLINKYGNKDWTNNEIEEILAEEFRKFVVDKEYNQTIVGKIKNAFKWLYDTIKSLFIKGPKVITTSEIDRLFNSIQSGGYRYAPVRSTSMADFYKDMNEYLYEIHGNDFTTITDPNHFFSVVKGLASTLVRVNNINAIEDLNELDFDLLKENLSLRYTKFTKAAIEKYENNSEEQKTALYLADLHREILDNFHIYQQEIISYLSTALNIRMVGDEEMDETISKSILAYSKQAFEYDAKDNALAAVKFVISFIPKNQYANPQTGMWDFMDFDVLWGRLMYDLHDADNIDDMLERIERIGRANTETEIGYAYGQLYAKLKKLGPQFRAQFVMSIRNHRHDFINMLTKAITVSPSIDEQMMGGGSLYIGQAYGFTDAHLMKAQDNLLNRWADAFYASKLFSRKEDKAQELREKPIKEVNEKYSKLVDSVRQKLKRNEELNVKSILERLTKLLNAIEIPSTEKDLQTYLDYYIPEHITELNDKILYLIESASFVLSTNSMFNILLSKIDFEKISTSEIDPETNQVIKEGAYSPDEKKIKKDYINQTFIRNLAKANLLNNNENQLNTIFGPDGNAYYIYSKLNYLTNLVKGINNNSDYYKQIKNGVYNTYSYLLKQLEDEKTRKGLSVVTFSAFIDKTNYDRGRGYSALSDLEEFLLKLSLFNAKFLSGESGTDIIATPVLGDRPTYFALKGLQKILFRYIIDENKNISIDESVITIFEGYLKDELNRIEQVKKDIEIAKLTNDYSNLVLNYHYTEKNGIKTFNGNGLEFQVFKMFNYEQFKDAENKRDLIKASLEAHINQTLATAIDLGVISKNEKGEYENILLPKRSINEVIKKNKKEESKGLLDTIAEQYNGDTSIAVQHIIADFAVNTIMAGIEFDKLFIGDPAFYKNAEDKIKRYQALTSTGDLLLPSTEEAEFSSETYNVLTAKTIKLKSLYQNALRDKLYEILKKDPKYKDESETTINNVITNIVESYGQNTIDPTDGQSYISAEMFKQIMGREGLWTPEKQKAFAILESTDENITPEQEQEAMALIMPVLKMMHFGYNNRLNSNGKITNVPIYDKTAMFPLFRRLVKGTHLEEVYDRMTGTGAFEGMNPVHVIKYDSAVKTGLGEKVELFNTDLDGNITGTNINGLVSYKTTEQRFEHLLHQLNTDPHDVEDIPMGTQVKKVGMLNILRDDAVYEIGGKQVTGQEIYNIITNSIKELSNKGRTKLLRKFGSIDGNLSKTQLKDIIKTLQQEAIRAGLPYNVVSSLRFDLNGLYLFIDSIADRKWVYNRIITLINKHTIDVHLPGNQLIQVANLGIKSRQSKDLGFIIDKNNKKIRGIEARVGISLFKNYIPSDLKTFEEKKQWLLKNKEVLAGFGYRIPTQGQNQIIPLHFVDFLPEQSGDIVILPNEFTTLTGSDFDIDKLYTIRYNYKLNDSGDLVKTKYIDGKENYQQRFDNYVMDMFFHSGEKYFSSNYKRAFINAKIEYYKLLKERKILNKAKQDEFIKLVDILEDLSKNTQDSERLATILSEVEHIVAVYMVDAEIETEFKFIKHKYNKVKNDIITTLQQEKLLPTIEEFKTWSIEQQNTSKALQNRLIDAYLSVLTSDAHFVEGYTPNGLLKNELTTLASEIDKAEKANKVLSLTEIEKQTLETFEDYSVDHNLNTKYRNLFGKEGVGPFALSNVHHAFAQQVGLKFKEANIGLGNEDEEGITDLSRIYGTDNIKISEWISAMIDAHVDIVKDPYIISLNVVKDTYSFVSLLLRAGVGKNTFYITAQPILKHYVKLQRQKRGKLGKQYFDTVEKLREEYAKIVQSKLAKGETFSSLDKQQFDLWDTDQLLADIKTPKTKRNAAWYMRQIKILNYFTSINKYANKLNALVLASQIDTKKFGTNPGLILTFKNKLRQALEDDTFVNVEKIIPYNPVTDEVIDVEGSTFLGTLLENSVLLSENIFDKVSITSTQAYKALTQQLILLTGNKYTVGEDGERVANVIFDEIYSLVASRFFIDDVNGLGLTKEKVEEIINEVPRTLQKIQYGKLYPEIRDNKFINMFIPETSEEDKIKYFAKSPSVKRNKWEKETITAEWEILLSHENPEIRKLATDMFIYSYYTTGFKTTAFGYQTFAPHKLYKQISDYTQGRNPSFDEYIRTCFDFFNTPEGIDYLLRKSDEIFRNNWHIDTHGKTGRDLSLVPEVDGVTDTIDFKPRPGVVHEHPAVISITHKRKSKELYVGENPFKQPIFRPFVKYQPMSITGTYLYEYIGYTSEIDEEDDNLTYYYPVYVATKAFGYYNAGKGLKEYGLQSSIIKENNYDTIPDSASLVNSIKVDSTSKQPREEFKTFVYIPKENRFLQTVLQTEEFELEPTKSTQSQEVTLEDSKQDILVPDYTENIQASDNKIQSLLSVQNNIEGKDNRNYYINGLDWVRVSNYVGNEITEESANLIVSSALGTAVDAVMRKVLNGQNVNLNDVVDVELSDKERKTLPLSSFMDSEKLNKLIESFKNIKKYFDEKGETIYTNNIVVFGEIEGVRVAGELDILTVDPKGKFHLYDLKTMTNNSYKSRFQSYKGEKSKVKKGEDQLNAYRKLLKLAFDIELSDMHLIPMVFTYTVDKEAKLQGDKVTTVTGFKMESWIKLQEIDIVNKDIKNLINTKTTVNIPQNLISGVEAFGTKQEANSEAKKLLGNSPHSIDMVEAGLRTRTTRSVGEMKKYNVKVGDIVTQFGKSADGTTKQVLTRITAIHPKGTPEFLGTWDKEGWTQDGIKAIKRFKDGAAAIEFEIVRLQPQNITEEERKSLDDHLKNCK